ncbi:rare lipoprotein A [Dactylococcopsis salina PCC 8305]|uniref:Probable endolytic peptidoglycan transglycosylase RlpA n=1 Tax=Dactylococcopsis salina (strain PCC 8305) TaxID=13035 RepID=K9YTW5_DACS8|nr:rare lipoprotein A [Dactylococcopsis salina PCC 8305]
MKIQLRQLLTLTLFTSALSVGLSSTLSETATAETFKSWREINQTDHSNSLLARMQGKASWYGSRFHGRRTASGERFNAYAHTAAHRSLPFGTKVRVTNLRNGRSVVVRINDRGPSSRGRVIDLSRAAAQNIGMLRSGVAPVRIEIIGR